METIREKWFAVLAILGRPFFLQEVLRYAIMWVSLGGWEFSKETCKPIFNEGISINTVEKQIFPYC